MGAIKTTKLDNGMVGLEITYGGPGAPFGGVDYSAPPPYIDPACFTDASGFLIADGQLVAVGWFQMPITLSGWTSSMTYLDSGSFFQNKNYWNWALASTSSYTPASGTTPGYTDTIYTIWTWQGLYPGSVTIATTLSVRQTDVVIYSTWATALIDVLGSSSSLAPSGGHCTFHFPTDPTGVHDYTCAWSINDPLYTVSSKIQTQLNNALGPPAGSNYWLNVGAGNSLLQIMLEPKNAGSAGNAYSVSVTQDVSSPVIQITKNFSGGSDSTTSTSSSGAPNPVTWTCIGETLYIGGYGTMILQYTQSNGVPSLTVCTQYLGAICIGKFNSQLIAAGVLPGPGLIAQGSIPFPEMTLAWSSPNEFTVWNPIRDDGTVTGAGYNQISDISDYLTGIFLTPGTCVILRTQGIDYITPLSGGVTPFDFSHISNSYKGEGCQHFKLVTEYDQIGSFIGNTNVFQFSGSLSPIGNKIRNKIFTFPPPSTYHNRDSASGPYNELRSLQVLSMFIMDSTIYIYDFNNKTWMLYYLASAGTNVFDIEWLTRDVIPPDRPQEYCNSSPILITEDSTTTQPLFWRLQPYIQDTAFPHATECYVTFPQEEISFGRDITIESAYVSIAGTPGTRIEFWISNKLHAELVLPPAADPTVYSNYQIWFVVDPTLNDKTTIQNPQLSVSLPLTNIGANLSTRISKIAVFGSFDPNQRPV